MRRTFHLALLAVAGVAALAMAISCESELSDSFQQLKSTTSTQVKLVDVTTGDSVSTDQIYDTRKVAQRFTLLAKHQIQGVFLKLVRTGDWSSLYPGAAIRAQIFLDSSGSPSSTQASSTTEVALVDSIPTTAPADSTGYIAFEFNIKPTLSPDVYWIVFSLVDNTDGSAGINYLSYFVNTSGTNQNSYYDGSGWNSNTGDLAIVLWGETVP